MNRVSASTVCSRGSDLAGCLDLVALCCLEPPRIRGQRGVEAVIRPQRGEAPCCFFKLRLPGGDSG